MPPTRRHRAVSEDGTEIVGGVYGQGPPLVLVHGGLGDGESTWRALLPFLAPNFTCYAMSTRGRGLSAAPGEPDYSLERLTQDVVAFAESVGEPAGLAGYSLGGTLGLGAAARSDAVRAVAAYEPAVLEAFPPEITAGLREAPIRMAAAADAGRPSDAARELLRPVAHEDEMAELESAGAFDGWARNVRVALQEIRSAVGSDRPGPTAPSTLARIRAPALALLGSRARAEHRAGAGHLAEHVEGLRVVEVEGVGHFGPLLRPEPIAAELVRFFRRTG
jgi:pimeloyl-ACP methyl ester carboxylesterase